MVIYLHYNKTPQSKATNSSDKQSVTTEADNERKKYTPQEQGVIKKLNPNDMVVVRVPSQKEQAKKEAMLNAKNVDIIAKEVQEIENALEKQAVEISKTDSKPIVIPKPVADNTKVTAPIQSDKTNTSPTVQPQAIQSKRIAQNSITPTKPQVPATTDDKVAKATTTDKVAKVVKKTTVVNKTTAQKSKIVANKTPTQGKNIQPTAQAKVNKPMPVNTNYNKQNDTYDQYNQVQDDSYNDYINQGYQSVPKQEAVSQDPQYTVVENATNDNLSEFSANDKTNKQQQQPKKINQNQDYDNVYSDFEDFAPSYVEVESKNPFSDDDINQLTNEIGVDLD